MNRAEKLCGSLALSLALAAAPSWARAQGDDCQARLQELRSLKGVMERHHFLREATAQCPDNALLAYYYAYSLERLRRYREALPLYEKAARLDPAFAKTHFGMGDVYLVLKEYRKAARALKKGLELEPDNMWARRSHEKALRLAKNEIGAAPPPSPPQPAPQGQAEIAADFQEAKPPLAEAQEPAAAASPVLKEVGTLPPAAAAPIVAPAAQEAAADKDERAGDGQEGGLLTIQFVTSSDDLSDDAKQSLEQLFCSATSMRQADGAARYEIAGHTDDKGAFATNMNLSRIRAEKVRDFLVERCALPPERFTVTFFGQTRPLFPNTTLQNRRKNRRVEIRRIPPSSEGALE